MAPSPMAASVGHTDGPGPGPARKAGAIIDTPPSTPKHGGFPSSTSPPPSCDATACAGATTTPPGADDVDATGGGGTAAGVTGASCGADPTLHMLNSPDGIQSPIMGADAGLARCSDSCC